MATDKTKIYRPVALVDDYQLLKFSDELAVELWRKFDTTKHQETWMPVEFWVLNPLLPRPDFFGLLDGVFVISERAVESLKSIVYYSGELLPVNIEDCEEDYFIWNILECVNCLDKGRTTWRVDGKTNQKLGIEEYIFVEERLPGCSAFKIPETVLTEMLILSGVFSDEDMDFKMKYELSGLTGLHFVPIWEQDHSQSS